MRYAQGGGLTAERRAFRERLRREAAERFACSNDNRIEGMLTNRDIVVKVLGAG